VDNNIHRGSENKFARVWSHVDGGKKKPQQWWREGGRDAMGGGGGGVGESVEGKKINRLKTRVQGRRGKGVWESPAGLEGEVERF